MEHPTRWMAAADSPLYKIAPRGFDHRPTIIAHHTSRLKSAYANACVFRGNGYTFLRLQPRQVAHSSKRWPHCTRESIDCLGFSKSGLFVAFQAQTSHVVRQPFGFRLFRDLASLGRLSLGLSCLERLCLRHRLRELDRLRVSNGLSFCNLRRFPFAVELRKRCTRHERRRRKTENSGFAARKRRRRRDAEGEHGDHKRRHHSPPRALRRSSARFGKRRAEFFCVLQYMYMYMTCSARI